MMLLLNQDSDWNKRKLHIVHLFVAMETSLNEYQEWKVLPLDTGVMSSAYPLPWEPFVCIVDIRDANTSESP